MTRGDVAVVAVLTALCAAAWPATLLAGSGQAPRTAVITGPTGVTRVPLDATRSVDVEGLAGTVRVLAGPAGVAAVRSDCPDGLCVRQGLVTVAGPAVVCAPMGVTARLEGGADDLDATVR